MRPPHTSTHVQVQVALYDPIHAYMYPGGPIHTYMYVSRWPHTYIHVCIQVAPYKHTCIQVAPYIHTCIQVTLYDPEMDRRSTALISGRETEPDEGTAYRGSAPDEGAGYRGGAPDEGATAAASRYAFGADPPAAPCTLYPRADFLEAVITPLYRFVKHEVAHIHIHIHMHRPLYRFVQREVAHRARKPAFRLTC